MKAEHSILIVDDDPDDILLFKEAISNTGDTIKVYTANCGRDCLKFLENFDFNIALSAIIVDFNMHDMTGAEVLKKISTLPLNKTLKIVWSTSNSPVYKKLAKDNGAEYYFVKPTDFNCTVGIVKEILQLIKGNL